MWVIVPPLRKQEVSGGSIRRKPDACGNAINPGWLPCNPDGEGIAGPIPTLRPEQDRHFVFCDPRNNKAGQRFLS
jgi:hypothetical protein